MSKVESIATRKERRAVAARARERGKPEITKQGACHIDGTCAGCYFWDTTDPNIQQPRGVCREGSAQLIRVGSQSGDITQALWPVTFFSVTCGRHITPQDMAAKKAYERRLWLRSSPLE